MATSAGYEVDGATQWVAAETDEQGRTLWAPTEFAWVRRLAVEEDVDGLAVGGRIDIAAKFRYADGQVALVELRIRPRAGGTGYGKFMRSASLERVGLQGLEQLSEVRGEDDSNAVDWYFDDSDHSHYEAVQSAMTKALGRHARSASRGRPPTDPELIEQAASIYKAAASSPLQAVADEQGVSRPTASRRIAKARAAGLLPHTTSGKASN